MGPIFENYFYYFLFTDYQQNKWIDGTTLALMCLKVPWTYIFIKRCHLLHFYYKFLRVWSVNNSKNQFGHEKTLNGWSLLFPRVTDISLMCDSFGVICVKMPKDAVKMVFTISSNSSPSETICWSAACGKNGIKQAFIVFLPKDLSTVSALHTAYRIYF